MTDSAAVLPPVTAEVAAGALDLLPARLRKRVDGAVAKAAGWPVEAARDGVLVRVAEDTAVTLRVTAGIVADPDDAVCSCLLAPACLHRAAVLSVAPLAVSEEEEEEGTDGTGSADGTCTTHATDGADGAHGAFGPEGEGEPERGQGEAGAPTPAVADESVLTPVLTPAQSMALDALREAVTAVLVSGISGSGAVHRAELLHAAHSARLAGLHRPAGTAVRIARLLGEARSDDPAFRLSGLSGELAELLDLVRRPVAALSPARRAYRPEGPLRLYGLFTEPVVTASGYAGATVYALAPDGALRTLSDVAPGGPDRALQASGTPVPGGCALGLREFGDGGGVILTAPTVSPDGRIGGGGAVRSVRAAGAGWREAPLATLWQRPPAGQLASALGWLSQPADARSAGGDLLFLDGVVTGAGFAVAGGPTLRLAAADERPELPYAENLSLLASRPGLALRLIARVVPDRPDRVHALAASWTGHDGEPVRADLGLRPLNRSHIPAVPQGRPEPMEAGAPPALPVELDLLRRAVDRAVAGGRAVSALSADDELPRRLRAVGLTTGARRVEALTDAAGDRRHDVLGRLLPADPGGFALAWLAAAVYASAATESLLLAAWTPPDISAN
ncbi:hypothetical protein [Streptomyces sp. 35G-GA-8]|uniref:hypothetical protein n=1 Tax=Streptomyces sp. 35G-GA-8 TaxID=2939434 RepID=UPI00201F5993|nr:hypothetical protein [Streptomyces sp. 35G-GA-8]MCL7377245.1 hypothetical protein [Streptomyces sp. 35G-GA-8]